MSARWQDIVRDEIAEAKARGEPWTPYRLFVDDDERKIGLPIPLGMGRNRASPSEPARCGTPGCSNFAAWVSYSTTIKARSTRCHACHRKAPHAWP